MLSSFTCSHMSVLSASLAIRPSFQGVVLTNALTYFMPEFEEVCENSVP